MSIRALAEKLELHHSIIGKIEQGGRKIDILEFAEYCKALDVDPHEGLDLLLTEKRNKS